MKRSRIWYEITNFSAAWYCGLSKRWTLKPEFEKHNYCTHGKYKTAKAARKSLHQLMDVLQEKKSSVVVLTKRINRKEKVKEWVNNPAHPYHHSF